MVLPSALPLAGAANPRRGSVRGVRGRVERHSGCRARLDVRRGQELRIVSAEKRLC